MIFRFVRGNNRSTNWEILKKISTLLLYLAQTISKKLQKKRKTAFRNKERIEENSQRFKRN